MSDTEPYIPESGGVLTIPAPAPQPNVVETIVARDASWPAIHRLGFRFVCCYFGLYAFSTVLAAFPLGGTLVQPYEKLWEGFITWSSRVILRMSQPVSLAPSGSGDKLVDYLQNLWLLIFALIATVVWTIVDRHREHTKLREWLRLYVRVALGGTMIAYGAFKVIQTQFAPPSPGRLMQPLGDMSPMGLLWTFMGFSPAYNMFTGLGELIGGVLLYFRKTVLPGSLLLIVVLANVVMLNFAFDVPVKIYSANLLLMAIWLAAYDWKRFGNVMLERAAGPARRVELTRSRKARYALHAIVLLLLGTTLFRNFKVSYTGFNSRATSIASPLYGAYLTEEFARNGVVLPPVLGDTVRWRRVNINGQVASIRLMNDSTRTYRPRVDLQASTITLVSMRDSTERYQFAYSIPLTGQLVLNGRFKGDSIHARFLRRVESDFLLFSRGYNWIQETPFNR